jgi:hypothetical protein
MRRELEPCALLLLALPAIGEAVPDWVTNAGISPKYPSTEYVADKSIPEQKKIGMATEIACADLVSTLRVNVSGENLLNRVSQVVGGRERITEDFRSTATTKTALSVEGIEVERYFEGGNKPAYVIAYLNKSKTGAHYAARFQAKMRVLREALAANAVTVATKKHLQEVEELMTIEALLSGKNSATDEDIKVVVDVAARIVKLSQEVRTVVVTNTVHVNRFPANMVWDNPDQAKQLSLDDLKKKDKTYHFKVVGVAPYPDDQNMSSAQRRLMAARAAKVLAMRDLLETVGKVRIDSRTKVSLDDPANGTKDECIAAVRGFLQGATFGEPKYLQDEVRVEAEVYLGPEFRTSVQSVTQK